MKTKLSRFSFFLFGIIIVSYITIRFVLFDKHGMKEFPDTLALISGALTALFILNSKHVSSILSSIGYIISFLIGLKHHTSCIDVITGNKDNLWLIWLISYAIIIGIGFIIDSIMFHAKQKKRESK